MNLINLYNEIVRKVRYALLFVGLLAIAVSVYFDDPRAKATGISSLITIYTILLLSYYEWTNKKLNTISDALQKPEPGRFKDFGELSDTLRCVIIEVGKKRRRVKIQVLAVSARFSWPFIYDKYNDIVKEIGKKCKFEIEFALVRPEILTEHNQEEWLNLSNAVRQSIETFRRRYATEFADGNIILSVYYYDNLPHWHGILIDGYYFYMGRTQWNFSIDPNLSPELRVGQIEYRSYTKDDSSDGAGLISRFEEWLKYYKHRSNILDIRDRRDEPVY